MIGDTPMALKSCLECFLNYTDVIQNESEKLRHWCAPENQTKMIRAVVELKQKD